MSFLRLFVVCFGRRLPQFFVFICTFCMTFFALSETAFDAALDFDGNNQYLIQNSNSDTYNPLRRNSNGGDSWSVSVLFKADIASGTQTLWGQT